MTASKYQGSCLCKEVRFEVLGTFERFFLCHCGRCRKGTGSAHAANLFSSTAALNWLSGQGSVRSYAVPGTRHERSFCANCGSPVPGMQMNGALLVVPAGSLDDEIDIAPDAHICVGSSAAWEQRMHGVPSIDGLPE